MQAVVGVVRTYPEALQIVEAVRALGIPDRHISVLSPHTPEGVIQTLPKTDAEQPGIGGTIGGVVGGAAGTAGGLSVASLALPGVGPVVAAGAIALGLLGAVAGAAVGSRLDDTLSKGLPTDELYVYRDALRRGRSVVVVTVEDEERAERVRQAPQRCRRGEHRCGARGVVDRPSRRRGGPLHARGRRFPEG